jgi:hypothetical protein
MIRAPFYAQLYPILYEKTLGYGYTLALHGTLQRDLDVIAVPWEENVSEPIHLIRALEKVSGGRCVPRIDRNGLVIGPYDPLPKPHGRLAWIIALSNAGPNGPYIDISVAPKQQNS